MEIYNPKKYLSKFTHSEFKSLKDYEKVYNSSIENPTKFWADVASSNLDWFKKWNSVYEGDFSKGESKWFSGAQLNLCYNAIDRHLNSGLSQKTALIWEGDNPQEQRQLSYQELFNLVCKISNALKKIGVKKGDRVSLYLPMIPELAASVLACARIGAIHSVIFAGFSSHSIRDRILDADSHWVITCNGTFRNGKYLSLKDKVDEALKECPCVEKVLIFERSQNSMQIDEEKDILFSQLEPNLSSECEAEKMESEDPLFILYTSGSTGKPKGVLHTTAGYGLYTAFTSKHVFNLQKNDVYFCTADIGWITGHSYLVYGPLINAATCVMFEGVPTYPSGSRFWEMIDRYQVSIFYTSPTAIRSLMRLGEDLVNKSNLKSLRLLGSVGEPINPEAWRWYYKNIGKENCPIVDTWWQTETGGILLSPLPAVTPHFADL
jgi:acetyl-CoA synthetase